MKPLLIILLLTGCGHWELNPYMDYSVIRECDGKMVKKGERVLTSDYACANATDQATGFVDFTRRDKHEIFKTN